jgi:hypothetical protein
MDCPHGQHECLKTIFPARKPANLSVRPSYGITALKLASRCPRRREKADDQLTAIQFEPAFYECRFDHQPSFIAGKV